jgi:hypothetical protein
VERRRIVQILTETGWNVSRAAARLGIPRSSLRYRLEKYGLQPSGAGPLPSDAEVRPFETAEPREAADVAGLHPIDWQDRHLTFLQVTLASETDEEPGGRAQRLLHAVLGKVQAAGSKSKEQRVSSPCSVSSPSKTPARAPLTPRSPSRTPCSALEKPTRWRQPSSVRSTPDTSSPESAEHGW